ncbi:MAG: hypothetical protein KF905_05600 [Flavobacteriales bacterium]|nr:hypothetical protein [Flavobacteriales bacterium]
MNIDPHSVSNADADGDDFGEPALTQQSSVQPSDNVSNIVDGQPTDAGKAISSNCDCVNPMPYHPGHRRTLPDHGIRNGWIQTCSTVEQDMGQKRLVPL